MIIDTLENADKYFSLNPHFAAAFRYLRNPAIKNLTSDHDTIDGEKIFAIASRKPGKKKHEAKLEVHKKYIDIQFVIHGNDSMGWKAAGICNKVLASYDPEKDIASFDDDPVTWCAVPAGTFAVFFPDDAHAPMVSDGEIQKVIIKVAVQ